MREIKLCHMNDLGPQQILKVRIAGHGDVAVYNLDGSFFCTDDICTHEEASLSDGEIEGCYVVCPFHAGTFDIRTGEADRAPCTQPIKTYPTRIIGEDIYIILV
jgi:p-cumate 2,3-dioxygenase ferredoxin subunit